MTQSVKTSKEALILKDFANRLLYETTSEYDFFSGELIREKTAIDDIDDTYLALYNTYPDDYKKLFAYFHQSVNGLFGFMNSKSKGNNHFNANESRELIGLIENIGDLLLALKNEGVVIRLDDNYDKIFKECTGFLSESYGSTIPDNFPRISIVKYSPIFSLDRRSSINAKQQASSIKRAFNSGYTERQIDQMLEAIEKHPSDAIGKAKELVESCLKAVLSNFEVTNLDKLEIPELLKEVKIRLELKSEHPAIKQVIGGLSGVAGGLAQLRNAKGTGHGKDAVRFREPSVIEARLSVDSALALTRFYWDLHQAKRKKA
jgi:hypothetical protein